MTKYVVLGYSLITVVAVLGGVTLVIFARQDMVIDWLKNASNFYILVGIVVMWMISSGIVCKVVIQSTKNTEFPPPRKNTKKKHAVPLSQRRRQEVSE